MKETGPLLKTARPVVLLVDDSEDTLDNLFRDLKGEYRICTAKNGDEAMAILQQELVQLVVSNVVMPGMDGLELCGKIKSTPELGHIPVILLTAQTSLQSKIQALKAGADACIEKPFSMEYLYAQIDNLLENRLKLKEWYANTPFLPINSTGHAKEDKIFWKQLTDHILHNLWDADLDVKRIALLMNMSKSTLSRKIKSIAGLSPGDVIHLARLKKSVDLINAGNFRINELAKKVGYHHPAQFRRNFQKQFKMSPAAYIEKVRNALRSNARIL